MYQKSRKQRRKRQNRKTRKQQRKQQRKHYRKQRGGLSEGFDDRVPDKALVVVRNAEEDDSPFVIVTKEEAMKNFTNRY